MKLLAVCLLLASPGLVRADAFALESDTVALWNFTEGEGIEVADQGPNAINLKVSSISTAEPTWTEGKFGKAMTFPGGVELRPFGSKGAPVDLSTGEVTVEAWVKPSTDAVDQEMAVIQYAAHSQWGFRFAIQKNGTLTWLLQTEGQEVGFGKPSTDKVPPGEWSHIAATYDGKFMRAYINGQMVAERELEGANLQPANNTPLVIGNMGAQSKPFFVGEINGIRISNKARTEFPAQ